MQRTFILMALATLTSFANALPKADFWWTANGATAYMPLNISCLQWKVTHLDADMTKVKCCDINQATGNYTGTGINCPGLIVPVGDVIGEYSPIGNNGYYVAVTRSGHIVGVEITPNDTLLVPFFDIYTYHNDSLFSMFMEPVASGDLDIYISDHVVDSPYYDIANNIHLQINEEFVMYLLHPEEAITIVGNPFSTSFVVDMTNLNMAVFGPVDILIYNNSGILVDSYIDVNNDQFTVYRNELPAGTYYVKVFSFDNVLLDQEIVIASPSSTE